MSELVKTIKLESNLILEVYRYEDGLQIETKYGWQGPILSPKDLKKFNTLITEHLLEIQKNSKEQWEEYTAEVREDFQSVFGESAPLVELIYHEGDYADNEISIGGILSIYQVGLGDEEWQLAKVISNPGSYNHPPETDYEEIDVEPKRLRTCIREAVKLYAEFQVDEFHECKFDQEMAAEREEGQGYSGVV